MELIVSHMSAADFWRIVYPLKRVPETAEGVLKGDGLAYNEEDVWQLAPFWVTPRFLEPENGILHVLVDSKEKRRVSSSHMTHLWSTPIPDGALYSMGGGAHVSSPAFVFLQLAQTLDFVQLICYGCELCGIYVFDEHAERGFNKRRRPLVNKEALEGFICEMEGVPGAKRARAALRYIVEGAGSPRETDGALLLSLPYKHGGYSLSTFVMNLEVPLVGAARKLYHKDPCRIDICFPEKNLAVEYLGLYDHSGGEAVGSDRGRTLALKEMGYEVMEVTKFQVDNLVSFEVVVLRISKILGRRIEHKYRGALPARLRLRRTLREWSRNSGRVKK